ncbi:acetyltransferase [Vibrio mimicus]|nr:acetyltransferase [Vibrio mimicus]
MVSVVAFEFGGMRCQPLRRALYLSAHFREETYEIASFHCFNI